MWAEGKQHFMTHECLPASSANDGFRGFVDFHLTLRSLGVALLSVAFAFLRSLSTLCKRISSLDLGSTSVSYVSHG